MAAELKIPPRLSTLSMAYRRHCDVCGSKMEVTEVATTEIATTFKIWQTGNTYIRK